MYIFIVLIQVVPLWRLLFELLYFLDHGIIDDVAVKAYSELTTGNNCIVGVS